MNRWEYIYTDVNSQYLQHRQERSQCLSPVSLLHIYPHIQILIHMQAVTHTHTHRHIHTQRVCGIKIEWTVWEHGAQQASLVSYFRQDFQWSKHITGHHSESRDRTRTGRAVGKHQNLFYFLQISHLLMSQRTVDHNIPCIIFHFWFPKESITAEDKWIMPVHKSWQRHSSSNLHTKYLNGEAIRWSNVGKFLHKVAHIPT